ncbi:MAG: alanyl-tRNA editing protein [Lachnospiraceae bacterium]|nr:alanyl-tRNA editing protein [Lachnospiraceae bacterium]
MLDSSTVKTGKIYYEDAYRVSFSAKVLSVEGKDVVLDETAFFPEEGGQSPDRGSLSGVTVVDVQIKDGYIHHILKEEPPFNEGDTVFGEIDWEHRFSNMQQHSGEHLFSGVVCGTYGYDNVGFHLSDSEVTLDFSGSLTMEEALMAEKRVNEAIAANIPSKIDFLVGEDIEKASYRSKLALAGPVRVVSFPGIDACACCAPHVKRTGEIGLLKVVSVMKWRTGVRVSILCGSRALALFDREHESLTRTARFLTTSADEVYNMTVKARKENETLRAALKKAVSEVMRLKVEAVPEGDGNVCLFEENLDGAAMREAVNALVMKRGGFSGVFSGSDDAGWNFVIGTQNGDARVMCAALRDGFGARGGGRPEMVQGSVKASQKEIANLFKIVLAKA